METPSPHDFSMVSTEEGEDDGGYDTSDGHEEASDDLTSRQARYLYVSHSLSMWTSRMYEFAVVILSTSCPLEDRPIMSPSY